MQNLEWEEIGHKSNEIIRIAHSGYDLFVEFKNGSGYKYLDVPSGIFKRILKKEYQDKMTGRRSYSVTLHKLVVVAGYKPEQYK